MFGYSFLINVSLEYGSYIDDYAFPLVVAKESLYYDVEERVELPYMRLYIPDEMFQSWPRDFLITDYTYSPIPQQVEDQNVNGYFIIQIKLPKTTLDYTAVELNILVGKPNLSDFEYSDGSSVFLMFDDFSAGVLNTDLQTVDPNTVINFGVDSLTREAYIETYSGAYNLQANRYDPINHLNAKLPSDYINGGKYGQRVKQKLIDMGDQQRYQCSYRDQILFSNPELLRFYEDSNNRYVRFQGMPYSNYTTSIAVDTYTTLELAYDYKTTYVNFMVNSQDQRVRFLPQRRDLGENVEFLRFNSCRRTRYFYILFDYYDIEFERSVKMKQNYIKHFGNSRTGNYHGHLKIVGIL